MLSELVTHTLINAIEDIEATVVGGGPPLNTVLAGMTHPEEDRPLFLSFDPVPHKPCTHIFAFLKRDEALAIEALTRLGVYVKLKYGNQATAPFTSQFIQQQLDQFTITTEGIQSQADDYLQQNLMEEDESLGTTEMDDCLLYTSPSPRDLSTSRMPSSA